MRKSRTVLGLSTEELEIDKVVDALEYNAPIEEVIEKTEKSIEKSIADEKTDKENDVTDSGDHEYRGDFTSDASSIQASNDVEDASSDVDEIFKTSTSLERLADLIDESINIGGLNEKSADMTNMVANTLCGHIGLSHESIDSNLFSNFSRRLKYTQEAKTTIGEAIKKVWDLLIIAIKKLIEFSDKLITLFQQDLFKQQTRLNESKSLFKRVNKVEPGNETISGILPQILLGTTGKTSGDVLDTCKQTISLITNYNSSFRRDVGTCMDSLDTFSEKTLDIPSEEDKDLELFKFEDLSKYGQFFGAHLNGVLKHVPNINGIPRPSNTMACYESDKIAGNFSFSMFTPDRSNILAEDILKSKMIFISSERDNELEAVDVCDVNDFRKLFQLTEEFIVLSKRTFDNSNHLKRSLEKMLSHAVASKSKAAKELYEIVDKLEIPSNSKTGVETYQRLSVTIKNFYTDPMNSLAKYSVRYMNALNGYIELSLREYT